GRWRSANSKPPEQLIQQESEPPLGNGRRLSHLLLRRWFVVRRFDRIAQHLLHVAALVIREIGIVRRIERLQETEVPVSKRDRHRLVVRRTDGAENRR